MKRVHISLALLSVAAAIGCSRFSADAPPDSSDGGDDSPGSATSGGIALRGKAQFPLQPGTAVVLSSPAESQPGDAILIAVAVTQSMAPAMVTAPAGFTVKGSRRIQGPAGCSWLDLAYFAGQAERGGADTYTFKVDATSDGTHPVGLTGLLASYSGVDLVQPIEDERESALDRDVPDGGAPQTVFYTTPSLTTLVPNTELLYFVGDNGGGSWLAPEAGAEFVTDTGVLAMFAMRSPAAGTTAAQRFALRAPLCGYTGGGAKLFALRPAK